MVFTDNTTGSSAAPPHHEAADDISLFLRQLLHRSSSSSTTSSTSSTPHPPPLPPPPPLATSSSTSLMRTHNTGDQRLCFPSLPISTTGVLHQQFPGRSAIFPGSDRLVIDRISDDTLSSVALSPPSYFPVTGGSNFSAESLTEYAEECDFDSEEGPEVVAEEAETKQPPSRNQSKRSRAAEVHNLSEKRRRSRINEKMKALQNLIPNSNKTDKASMLDEAIEYLKQLQLQVQMLSMRNGISLHPMCLPGVAGIFHPDEIAQMGIDLANRGQSLDINMSNALNMTLNTSDSMFNLPPNQCAPSERHSLPPVSTITNPVVASFGIESCIQDNYPPIHLYGSSQVPCREENVPHERLVANNAESKSLVTTMSPSFDTRDSHVKGHNSLEACSQQKYRPQDVLLQNVSGHNQLISSNFSGLYAATTSAQNDKLTIRR